MALKIDSNIKITKIPYTAKDILENEYPEMWLNATAVVDKLVKYQQELVNMLTACKGSLPNSFDELKELDAQRNLSDYIRIRSLYSFVHKLWKLMDEQCLNLAQKTNEQDSDGVDVAKSVLQDTIEKEIGFPYEDIAQDCVEGLLRLNEMIERFQKRMYIPVFTNWSFSDIIGTIINYGLQYEPLWQSAINDDVPSGSNIGDLLADNKMIRAY